MVVDDSSSSPSFRELDDVFLQSQARIWLAEVLHMRFDEQLNISDLLSDGELLFEVSKVLWNMLLVKYMELKNIKARMFIPVDTRKSSGRYRPYSNVDSFLKICKVMGLSGVDLFSPSDVVEKRDTRKVCICIRSLSKKARSKQLNVPDFDIVTKTVAMPTEAVRCIRRSLESSTSSDSHGKSKHARLKFRQKSSYSSHKQEDKSCIEESDEAKNNFPDTSYADFLYLESGDSPETLYKFSPTQDEFEFEFDFDFDSDADSEPDDHETLISSTPDLQQPESKSLRKVPVSCIQFLEPRFEETLETAKSYSSEDQEKESRNQIYGAHKDSGDSVVVLKDDITNVGESIEESVVSKEADDNVMEIEEDDKRVVNTEKKSTYIAPLLKTVAKGTALVGILFLLHLRIRSDGNTNNKFNGVGLSRRKGEKGSKVYPADKFKFGD